MKNKKKKMAVIICPMDTMICSKSTDFTTIILKIIIIFKQKMKMKYIILNKANN